MNPDKSFQQLRIVFMGTPDFAVASLEALLNSGCRVVAVVTAPDKLAGRGMKMSASAVKQFAEAQGLPVLQPAKLKDPAFVEALRAYRADLQVVVAFRMLPEVVWNMPPMGTINIHASLLPQYRGAAPINWAIINGETETGITSFRLKHEIDTGNILLQEKLSIGAEETAGALHDRMKLLGAGVLVRTLRGLADGSLLEIPQPASGGQPLRPAPKISTETCRIQWDRSTVSIYNLVRGLSPFPGAFSELDGRMLKIYNARMDNAEVTVAAGTWQSDGHSWLRCATADGYLLITELQLEGKKRMSVGDFLRGYRGKNLQIC